VRAQLAAAMAKLEEQEATSKAGTAEEVERQRQLAAREEQERLERVEHLKAAAMRRLGQQGIAKGWTTWVEKFEARRRNEQMMRAAGARLLRPKLTASFAHWRHGWEAAMRLAQEKATRAEMEAQKRELAEKRAAIERELWAQRQENSRIVLERMALEDERDRLLDKMERMTREREAAMKRIATREEESYARELSAAHVAEDASILAQQQAEEQQQVMETRMKHLLQEQRTTLLADTARVKDELNESTAREERLQSELREQREAMRELERQVRTMAAEQSRHAPAAEPKAPTKYKKGSVLGNLDLDEASGKTVAEQLKDVLTKNAGRVIDLFREWDADGDGVVSRKEFHKAMPALGLEVPKKEIDALFDTWDPDNSGSIEYSELKKLLQPVSKEAARRKSTAPNKK